MAESDTTAQSSDREYRNITYVARNESEYGHFGESEAVRFF
jgi:hypothetical protein